MRDCTFVPERTFAAWFVVLCGLAFSHAAMAAGVPPLTADGLPNVQAESSLVVDLDSGEVLFAHDDEAPRPIASVTKLFGALVVVDRGLDLDAFTTIDPVDVMYARRGARSRLRQGQSFTNRDLLVALLVGSDNRAATALGRAVGLGPEALIRAMNVKAARLGHPETFITDPTGLHGNIASARAVAAALGASLRDPVLRAILSTDRTTLASAEDPERPIAYANTNQLMRTRELAHRVLGGKTGYTDAARYCLAVGVTVGRRRVGMVFLGAHGRLTRFADARRVLGWLDKRGYGADKGNKGTSDTGSRATSPGDSSSSK